MRAGRVVTFRINPRDCMAAVDVVEKVGMLVQGMSFAQVVSIALSSGLETLRQHSIIPSRDGFEYSEMMQRFPADSRSTRAKALAITKALAIASPYSTVPTPAPNKSERAAADNVYTVRFNMLMEKKNAGEVLAAGEERELLDIIHKLYD